MRNRFFWANTFQIIGIPSILLLNFMIWEAYKLAPYINRADDDPEIRKVKKWVRIECAALITITFAMGLVD